MNLYEGETNCEYIVRGIYVEEAISRRLQALGMNEGTRVKLLNRKKKGAIIVQVRGTRLALGSHISSGIEIREVR